MMSMKLFAIIGCATLVAMPLAPALAQMSNDGMSARDMKKMKSCQHMSHKAMMKSKMCARMMKMHPDMMKDNMKDNGTMMR